MAETQVESAMMASPQKIPGVPSSSPHLVSPSSFSPTNVAAHNGGMHSSPPTVSPSLARPVATSSDHTSPFQQKESPVKSTEVSDEAKDEQFDSTETDSPPVEASDEDVEEVTEKVQEEEQHEESDQGEQGTEEQQKDEEQEEESHEAHDETVESTEDDKEESSPAEDSLPEPEPRDDVGEMDTAEGDVAADEGVGEDAPNTAASEAPAPSVTTPKKTTPKASPRKPRTPSSARSPANKKGLLDVSPTVEGKRVRKKTDRLTGEDLVKTPSERKSVIPDGKGCKLSEIPFIDHMLGSHKPDQLMVLYRACYGRVGSKKDTRKRLYQFSGFDFDEGSKQHEHKMKSLTTSKWLHTKEANEVVSLLGLERQKTKDENIKVIVDFLMKPFDHKKVIPKAAAKTPGKRGRKRGASKGGAKKTPAKRGRKSATTEEAEEVEDSSDEEGSGDEEKASEKSVSEQEDAASEPEEPKEEEKPTTSRRGRGRPAGSGQAATPSKGKPPTEAQISKTIKTILKDADLETVTMKTVCKQVADQYPTFDLSGKKEFMKSTVRDVLASKK